MIDHRQPAGITLGELDQTLNPIGANNCSSSNFAQRAVIKALTYVAQKTGETVGFGAGGSAGIGFGKGLGAYATGSRQIIVSPNGSAYFVSSFGGTYPLGSNWFTPVTKGVGATFGFQVSLSNSAPTSGPSLDVSAGGGDELGGGVDGSISLVDGSGQLTATGGVAAGGFGGAGAVTNTTVVPVCQ